MATYMLVYMPFIKVNNKGTRKMYFVRKKKEIMQLCDGEVFLVKVRFLHNVKESACLIFRYLVLFIRKKNKKTP